MTLQLTHYNPSQWYHTLAKSVSESEWASIFAQFHLEQIDDTHREKILHHAMSKGYQQWCIDQVQAGILQEPKNKPQYKDLKYRTIVEIHAWLTSPWWNKNEHLDIGIYDIDLLMHADTEHVSNDEFAKNIHHIHALWNHYNIHTANDIWTWLHYENRMIPDELYVSRSNLEYYTILDSKMPKHRLEILIAAIITHLKGDLALWMISQSMWDRETRVLQAYTRCINTNLATHRPQSISYMPHEGLLNTNHVLEHSAEWIAFQRIAPLYDIDIQTRVPIVNVKNVIDMVHNIEHVSQIELELNGEAHGA